MYNGSDVGFAGVLYKWTNYGKGWRSRWFTLKNGVFSYWKTRRPENLPTSDVRVIGGIPVGKLSSCRSMSRRGSDKSGKSPGIVHLKTVYYDNFLNGRIIVNGLSKSGQKDIPLKELGTVALVESEGLVNSMLSYIHLYLISSFRESRSDDRRFYIFTSTKTLHLRTNSSRERVAWIEALNSTANLFTLKPFNENLSILPNNISISTEKLKKRLLEEGIGEGLVKDCEQIMLTEFSEVQGQYKILCKDRCSLLDTLRQLEAANVEAESSGIHGNEYQLMKNDFSNLVNAKFGEWSTTESSDDVERQELEETTDEETNYFDTSENFYEPSPSSQSIDADHKDSQSETNHMKDFNTRKDPSDSRRLVFERRKKLPDPVEKEKGASMWSMIKDNVGKDLTRVCLPVYFNEPISSLQRCFEDLEYSYLLDRAYEHGKAGDSLLRILNVAAFAVSGYASTQGRHCKPFNPLLGETYEADYPEKGIRFFSEKVSHHPTVIACHCQGKGWKFFGDSNLKSKFWGTSIQLDPVGTLTAEFDDGEIFQWGKVTTGIYNLILGKIYCVHHGTMLIGGNRQHSCNLKFKEQSLLDRNPQQVHGFVEDVTGKKVATLFGKWNESMYYIRGEGSSKMKDMSNAQLLWKRDHPPVNLTRYNLTSFAITLNELTPGLKEKLPPTDSRLRPDQRHLENGEYDKANAEKLRLETRQRMSRKLQEDGWKPKWFSEHQDGAFRFLTLLDFEGEIAYMNLYFFSTDYGVKSKFDSILIKDKA
ncbi:hypothetical protein Leryth_021362 [Lithospermum erythrorhizon]|nr:hypothetical protein Leryth_021362 [Lithospermum erythrorhizon]